MKIVKYISALFLLSNLFACEDFLNKEPLSTISSNEYFSEESQLQAYLDGIYVDILPSHSKGGSNGIFDIDNNTDNQVSKNAHARFTTDMWQVTMDGGNWNFNQIFKCNYFLYNAHLKFGDNIDGSGNTIKGDLNAIKHYIGEGYFLRACEYFTRYQEFGDFPIVTEPLPVDMESLRIATKRSPRNEVARFIMSDLDKAYQLLESKSMVKTRINKEVALLLKSRVALFEGTWLKYFKNTAFVPNGPGWPGKDKDYNKEYEYPSGSIENEINFFLSESMQAAKLLGDEYIEHLTTNTGLIQQHASEPINPYYNMFGDVDLSKYDEVLMWREYAYGVSTHNVAYHATCGNDAVGLTRGYVQNFLMEDGSPVYSHGSYSDGDGYYKGDKTIADVRVNRDSRLSIFLVEPGQRNILYEDPIGYTATIVAGIPQIDKTGAVLNGSTTGYFIHKGGSFYSKYSALYGSCTGAICYRATEALLNYIEASYELNSTLDNTAEKYWKQIRKRSKVNTDIYKTIGLTQMEKEAENDWGAYSGGKILEDKILYNIRRERRCELLAEGFRLMDLRRWRSMDQLINAPYHIEGFHLWNTPMQNWYAKEQLIDDGSEEATVSSSNVSEYLRPFQINTKQTCYNGCTWRMAHYLSPIALKQILIAASDGISISKSPIYQNPYWPVIVNEPAEQ